jgi:hypothetical protein
LTAANTPETFAKALVQKALQTLIQNLPTTSAYSKFIAESVTDHKRCLGAVIQAFHELMTAWKRARNDGKLTSAIWPVLIIDEAHELMRWSGEYKSQLDRLLDLLVSITRRHSCHVLLVTYDYSILDWINDSKYLPLCIHMPPAYVYVQMCTCLLLVVLLVIRRIVVYLTYALYVHS